jgi:hypothetical protein
MMEVGGERTKRMKMDREEGEFGDDRQEGKSRRWMK